MIQANALHIPLKNESVQMCCTSPPYWGLRDYGTATWEGGRSDCVHTRLNKNVASPGNLEGSPNGRVLGLSGDAIYKDICKICGAKRIDNQFGLEKTPEEFVENCVKWAREVRRVLRTDGCFFLNLGDSYFGDSPTRSRSSEAFSETWDKSQTASRGGKRRSAKRQGNLKPKDLCGIPWKVAFALQADGWWLRSAMPWVKRSAMPESCNDRPASALEYVFLLTKGSKYYFDMDAIRKKVSGDSHPTGPNGRSGVFGEKASNAFPTLAGNMPTSRNFRNTDLFYQSLKEPHGAIFCGNEMIGLDVNPHGFDMEMCENCNEVYFGKEYKKLKSHPETKNGKVEYKQICKVCLKWDKWKSHFATFPEKLVEPLIKAGTSEKGACSECGAPWERMIEKGFTAHTGTTETAYKKGDSANRLALLRQAARENGEEYSNKSKTIGWQPTCKCNMAYPDIELSADDPAFVPYEPVPCIVLDIFGGSGTTKNVADRLGRRGVMLELKMEYIEMAKKRCYREPQLDL